MSAPRSWSCALLLAWLHGRLAPSPMPPHQHYCAEHDHNWRHTGPEPACLLHHVEPCHAWHLECAERELAALTIAPPPVTYRDAVPFRAAGPPA